jgi:hypothetical protein
MLTLAKVVEVRISSKLKTPSSPSIRCHLGFPDIENRSGFQYHIIDGLPRQARARRDNTKTQRRGVPRVIQLADATLYSENEQLDNL